MADVTGYSPDRIEAWEEGRDKISIPQLKTLAKAYKTSITTFFLPSPPPLSRKHLVDRRVIPNSQLLFSPQLSYLIESLTDKQEWLSQDLKERECKRINISTFTSHSSLETIVSDIKAKLQVDILEQIQTKSPREALNLWIDRVEKFGINVSSRSNGIPLDEFRAFVLYDEYVPFICLNSKDSAAGRLFSLCHEIAHLWLKESVLSNINTYESDNKTEILCNEIASRLLIDHVILSKLWKERNLNIDLAAQIQKIASKFSVSEESIARSLYKQNYLSQDDYQTLRALYTARWRLLERKKRSGGPKYGLKMVLENGRYFAQEVLYQYDKGRLLGAEASRLLGVKINNFHSLKENLPPRI